MVTNLKAMPFKSFLLIPFTMPACFFALLGIGVVGVLSAMDGCLWPHLRHKISTHWRDCWHTRKFDSSMCWYVVNRWPPFTLDPTYDISNEREASGESICFYQNGSTSESYSVTGLVQKATQLYLFCCVILSIPSLVLVLVAPLVEPRSWAILIPWRTRLPNMHAGRMIKSNSLIRVLLMEIIGWWGGWLLVGLGFETADTQFT